MALQVNGGEVEGSNSWQRLEFTRPQMGVPFRIVLYATDEAAAQQAVEAAYQRVSELNSILSDYDPESEINRFCHRIPVGTPAPVGSDFWLNLQRSQRLARETGGAFDVTVGPLVNLWRRARRHRELPPPGLIEEARAAVGWHRLQLDARRRTVTMRVPGMRFDFGGIAKGYAADEALRVLKARGFPRALVAASGDVTVGEAPPQADGWRVEVGPSGTQENLAPPRVLQLHHRAVSTSGDLFQFVVIDGRKYSHIVDPKTGVGLVNQALVTVVARDGTTADSLATAVSVLGAEEGLRLVERTRGVAAMIVERNPAGGFASRESRRWRREFGRSDR
ncbi:MAG: FAD:protein FMN transferase [Verrucomicrobiales bacterium]|nr:FAD:protein FMN transferase [Verrucomicrobiales bacterium]